MSLLQYLSQRLLLLGLVVSVGLFYIVYILYQWGLDDSTEYYLKQDMQWAVEVLANNQALPSNTPFRQFYLTDNSLTINQLPEKYASLLISNKHTEYFYLEDNVAFQYDLHQRITNDQGITVVHQFTVNKKVEGLSLLEISIASSLVLIIIMLLGAWCIYQRISRSMQYLLWAAQRNYAQRNYAQRNYAQGTNAQGTNADLEQRDIRNDFVEIDNIVRSLENALEKLENKNEQEILLIQTLSHELRTPMATIQVALELLSKKELVKKEMNENVREKIEIIFNSNQ